MQGLDDYLLENEDQIAHAFENLCEGFPWLFEVQTTVTLVLMFNVRVPEDLLETGGGLSG